MPDINVKYHLFKTYCTPLYGSPLLDYENKCIDKLLVALRKSLKRLLNISPKTHCNLVPQLFNKSSFLETFNLCVIVESITNVYFI